MSRRIAAGLLTVLAIAVSPGLAAAADFGIVPGSLAIRTVDKDGNPDNRAGAHPDRVEIDFGLTATGTGTAAKDFIFELSPGLASSSDAVPRCSREWFEEEEQCPADTQVGLATLEVGTEGGHFKQPIFNIQPAPNETAVFGAKVIAKMPVVAELRPDDFGLTLTARNLPQIPVNGGSVELWSVPADHQEGDDIPRRAFLTTPTRCEPLEITLHTRSWQAGGPWLSQSAQSEAPLDGCDGLLFQPKLDFSLSNRASDSPTGAQVELTTPPENTDPDGRASSQIKNVTVELPDGVSLSPAGASGLKACSDDQFALGAATKASCPPSSKVGSVKLESPALREALTGDLYLGTEHPGERFRLLIAATGPGVVIKLASALEVDSATGQISVAINKLPQVPIEHMVLSFDAGSHALLATPLTCGSAVSAGRFEPYSGGAAVNSSASTSIVSAPSGAPCPDAAPFAPALEAGSSDEHAGRQASFSMTMRRRDGEQLPNRFSVTLPAGLSAALGTVKLCQESAARSGACPAGSRVGSAVVEFGSGSSPALLRGEAYLTEPYRRAPFGLSLAFPAQIGPFDLGNVVMRGTLRTDKRTGQVTIETDPLPQVFDGVPARIRTIGIDLDRPGFVRNPTSCEPTTVDAMIQAVGGASATAATPFSLVGCDRLGFKPRFSLAMMGRSELHKRGKPGLSISAKFRRGNTNLQMMKLSLPKSLKFNPAGVEEICSHRDAVNGMCADRSRLGSVQARTPMLDKPLKGGIFAVRPEGDGLPDLWLSLASTGVHMALRGETSQLGERFSIKLLELPDMPLSNLEMRLPGGPDGALSLRSGLCVDGRSRQLSSPVAASGQDGAFSEMRVGIRSEARCGAGGRTG